MPTEAPSANQQETAVKVETNRGKKTLLMHVDGADVLVTMNKNKSNNAPYFSIAVMGDSSSEMGNTSVRFVAPKNQAIRLDVENACTIPTPAALEASANHVETKEELALKKKVYKFSEKAVGNILEDGFGTPNEVRELMALGRSLAKTMPDGFAHLDTVDQPLAMAKAAKPEHLPKHSRSHHAPHKAPRAHSH